MIPDLFDESGPPTLEDDLWFLEHVIAAGYPKVKRAPEPMEGQVSLFTALNGPWTYTPPDPDGLDPSEVQIKGW